MANDPTLVKVDTSTGIGAVDGEMHFVINGQEVAVEKFAQHAWKELERYRAALEHIVEDSKDMAYLPSWFGDIARGALNAE